MAESDIIGRHAIARLLPPGEAACYIPVAEKRRPEPEPDADVVPAANGKANGQHDAKIAQRDSNRHSFNRELARYRHNKHRQQ